MTAIGTTRDEGLSRGIGTFGLAAATVNAVIGAGIFSLPAGMARAAGPYALVAYEGGVVLWFVCRQCAHVWVRGPDRLHRPT